MQLTDYYKDYYKNNGYKLEDNLKYSRVAFIKKHIEELCPKDASILDIGCGDAGLSKILPDYDYFGLDINTEAVSDAKAQVKLCDISQPPYDFADKYFSCIVISEVLEHMVDPECILKEAHRLLKDNGVLIVSTPNANWIDYKLFPEKFTKAYRKNSPHTWEHIRHYDHFSFLDLFDATNFKIKSFNGCDAHFSPYLSKARSTLLKNIFDEDVVINDKSCFTQTENLTLVDMLLGDCFPLDSHTLMFVCTKSEI